MDLASDLTHSFAPFKESGLRFHQNYQVIHLGQVWLMHVEELKVLVLDQTLNSVRHKGFGLRFHQNYQVVLHPEA